MGYDYNTKKYMITWRGKQYDRSCHRAIVDGIEYDISGWREIGDEIYKVELWNDDLKKGHLYLTREKVDNCIDAIIPYTNQDNKIIVQEYDHPDAIGFREGLVLYIIAMIFGSIFKDRLYIWIFGSIIFWRWADKKPKWK